MKDRQKDHIDSIIRALMKAQASEDMDEVLRNFQYASLEINNLRSQIFEEAPKTTRGRKMENV